MVSEVPLVMVVQQELLVITCSQLELRARLLSHLQRPSRERRDILFQIILILVLILLLFNVKLWTEEFFTTSSITTIFYFKNKLLSWYKNVGIPIIPILSTLSRSLQHCNACWVREKYFPWMMTDWAVKVVTCQPGWYKSHLNDCGVPALFHYCETIS